MRSWLKGRVSIFRQGYKDGRELAKEMHSRGVKTRSRGRMIRRAEELMQKHFTTFII